MGFLFSEDEDYSEIFWSCFRFIIIWMVLWFCLKWLVKCFIDCKTKGETPEPPQELVIDASVAEIIAEQIIAKQMNKSADEPPSYEVATKDENVPPPTFEEIVMPKKSARQSASRNKVRKF